MNATNPLKSYDNLLDKQINHILSKYTPEIDDFSLESFQIEKGKGSSATTSWEVDNFFDAEKVNFFVTVFDISQEENIDLLLPHSDLQHFLSDSLGYNTSLDDYNFVFSEDFTLSEDINEAIANLVISEREKEEMKKQ